MVSSAGDPNRMTHQFTLIEPRVPPYLDGQFRPAVLANRAFEQASAGVSEPLVFGLQRGDGNLSRFETRLFPENHPLARNNFYYAERIFKFLLWQRGGEIIYIGGPRRIGEYLQKCYAPGEERSFDFCFMREQVYGPGFHLQLCEPGEVPPAHDIGRESGRYLDGCRIGFDLGASDLKVSAVMDGKVVFSEEIPWDPRTASDPEYHFHEVTAAIKTAASKMPRVDAIGGSSAGIIIDNRPMVASLFRGVPPERFSEVHNLFLRIQDAFQVPLEVINDGDVTALAGSMSLEDNGILGIAMGSSQAAGYIDMHGHIMGWLNELAFAPVDYSPVAPVDEWSGDRGCGAQYFSQQCIFRLAPRAGIQVPEHLPDIEKLKFIQEKLQAGHEGAARIWQSLGVYLGYALAHYADFYDMKHVLILGRCTSGLGGSLIVDEARKVLETEFPQLAARLRVQLPDEHSRRVGQSIAAASLPAINPLQEKTGRGHA